MFLRLPTLEPLSLQQQVGWYVGSIVYGVSIVLIAADSGTIQGTTSDAVPIAVFGISWLVGVLGMRPIVQALTPQSTLRDLFQLPHWLRRK